MPTYLYEAMDNTGLEVKETVEAESEAEAQQLIRDKGFFVTKIQEKVTKKKKTQKKKSSGKEKATFSIGGVKAKQLCTFTRQLSTLQDAGLPILRSLQILKTQAKPGPLKNALIGTIEDIESGSTLSEAMSRHPKAFDNLYVNMVKAGEAGGALEIVLRRLAEFKERAQSLKRKVIGAMIYPIAVVTVATLIVAGIMYYIIPKFKKIFADFGIELPEITKLLLRISDWVVAYWYLIPAIPIGFWLIIKITRKNRTGAYLVDRVLLMIPIIGGIIEKSTVARTSRTLGTLIASGVPILEAILIARDTAGNAVFAQAFDTVYTAIREGESIAAPLKQTGVVDDIVVNMIDVGEETGALDEMLYKIADVYDEEVTVLVDSLVSMLEPIMVIVLGGMVGFIVIALFYPLIKIIQSLT